MLQAACVAALKHLDDPSADLRVIVKQLQQSGDLALMEHYKQTMPF